MSNILCFTLLHPLIDASVWVREFCMASLSLGIINLIPIRGFDGGRILHALLSLALPVSAVEKISSILGFFSLLCIWLLSVWLLLRTGTSLTLFVFSCCLFAMLFV
jgi:Zn-dependent protease